MKIASLVMTAVLLLGGCGASSIALKGTSPSPSAAQTGPFVGYWQGPSKATRIDYLFRVERNGSAYEVAANNWAPWPVPMKNGRLILHRYGQWPARWCHYGAPLAWYGLELAWSRGHVVALITTRKGVFASTTLTRTSAASYERQNRAWADRAMPVRSCVLWEAAGIWAQQHGGVPPAPSEMNPRSALAKWLAKLPKMETTWPTNLYTGAPMKQGTQPGDFTYTTDGSKYRLVGHLSGGKSYVAP